MKDIEQRAEDYAKESILIDDPSYTSGLFYGYLAGATEERERGKRFGLWMHKNDLSFVNDDIFNSFLAEERELNS